MRLKKSHLWYNYDISIQNNVIPYLVRQKKRKTYNTIFSKSLHLLLFNTITFIRPLSSVSVVCMRVSDNNLQIWHTLSTNTFKHYWGTFYNKIFLTESTEFTLTKFLHFTIVKQTLTGDKTLWKSSLKVVSGCVVTVLAWYQCETVKHMLCHKGDLYLRVSFEAKTWKVSLGMDSYKIYRLVTLHGSSRTKVYPYSPE